MGIGFLRSFTCLSWGGLGTGTGGLGWGLGLEGLSHAKHMSCYVKVSFRV